MTNIYKYVWCWRRLNIAETRKVKRDESGLYEFQKILAKLLINHFLWPRWGSAIKVVRITLFTLCRIAISTKVIRFPSRTNFVRIAVQIFVRLEQVQCKRKADPNNFWCGSKFVRHSVNGVWGISKGWHIKKQRWSSNDPYQIKAQLSILDRSSGVSWINESKRILIFSTTQK